MFGYAAQSWDGFSFYLITLKFKTMSDVTNYQHADLTSLIIKEAYHVFNKLGYGFVESVYENSLAIRLRKAGLKVDCQYPIKVYFEEEVVGDFKADIIVNNVVIVELKARCV